MLKQAKASLSSELIEQSSSCISGDERAVRVCTQGDVEEEERLLQESSVRSLIGFTSSPASADT